MFVIFSHLSQNGTVIAWYEPAGAQGLMAKVSKLYPIIRGHPSSGDEGLSMCIRQGGTDHWEKRDSRIKVVDVELGVPFTPSSALADRLWPYRIYPCKMVVEIQFTTLVSQ